MHLVYQALLQARHAYQRCRRRALRLLALLKKLYCLAQERFQVGPRARLQ